MANGLISGSSSPSILGGSEDEPDSPPSSPLGLYPPPRGRGRGRARAAGQRGARGGRGNPGGARGRPRGGRGRGSLTQ